LYAENKLKQFAQHRAFTKVALAVFHKQTATHLGHYKYDGSDCDDCRTCLGIPSKCSAQATRRSTAADECGKNILCPWCAHKGAALRRLG
jgi:hypothetical protein